MPTGLSRPLRRSVEIACQVVRERDFKLIARRTVDLSEEGMRVASLERVLTGEAVLVSFRAPLSHLWIDAEAIVARVLHGRRLADRGPALGLLFESLSSASRALLRAQLGWFAEPCPRAR